MITKLSLELDDAQRNQLAVLLDERATKRLATRAEVSAFAEALLLSTIAKSDHPAIISIVDRLRQAGKSEDYITSYMRGYACMDSKNVSFARTRSKGILDATHAREPVAPKSETTT